MLQAIREKAQGWIAWAIVILISIPFALWGIQEYLGVGSEPEVAVVDGEEITQRMLDERTRDFRERLRQSLGSNYSPDLLDDARLKAQVLDSIVEERVLINAADAWNLRTGDDQARRFIAAIPAFQREGRFDQQSYEAAVRNRGMSRAGFEQRIRQDMAVDQLRSGIADSAFVTQAQLATRVRLRDEQRSLSHVRIPAADYLDEVAVTQDELRRFYQDNTESYRTPERVKLSYLLLDAAALGGLVQVDEERLRQYFENHKAEFVAREERAMRHILIGLAPGAEEDAVEQARAQAQALLEALRGGADFAALAAQHSADPGSAANGGDLGWVERGMMVPAFEEAAFALDKGAVSEVVQTDFGFHVIQVTDIRGGSDAEFDEMRDKVEAGYRKFEGENLYFDYAERLAEIAYENSDSLVPAAEALDLVVQTSDWLTRNANLSGVLGSPKVVNAAFSDDVLMERHNSELIEVDSQQAVVVRVAEYEPAGVEPFEDNLAAIEQAYRQQQASKTAAESGSKLIAELRGGERTLAQLAADNAWRLEQPGAVGREEPQVPAAVLDSAFGLTPPSDGEPAFAGVMSPEGDYLLIEVSAVEGGALEALPDAERPLIAEQAASQLANAQTRYVTQELRDRADIELKPIDD
jgi:peptidyl-prolyl cis-trans isomerase D